MTIREAAALYHSLGMIVQPVHGYTPEEGCTCGDPACDKRDQGKHARTEWEQPWSPSIIPEGCNIAIRTGLRSSGPGHLVCLDLDREVPLEFLAELPVTRTHKTPRGLHYFYTVEDASSLKNWNDVWGTWQGGRGAWWMDLRVLKGRVLAPPSRTPWGDYTILNGVSPIAPLPVTLYNEILSYKRR